MSQYNVQLQDGNGALAGLRNQLINGNMDIAQRGSSGTSTFNAPVSDLFTADRWLAYARKSGTTISWSVDSVSTADIPNVPISSYLRLQTPAGQDGWNFEQRIELPATNNVSPFDAGTSWTLSFWAYTAYPLSLVPSLQIMESGVDAGSSAAFTDQGPTAITQNSWNKYTFNFTSIAEFTSLPTNSNSCRLRFGGPTDGVQTDFYISNVQLEPGPIVTPFELRPIGLELSLCQRYFYTGRLTDHAATTPYSSQWILGFNWPVTMRTSPTVATTGITLFYKNVGTSSNSSAASIETTADGGRVLVQAGTWSGTAAPAESPLVSCSINGSADAEL